MANLVEITLALNDQASAGFRAAGSAVSAFGEGMHTAKEHLSGFEEGLGKVNNGLRGFGLEMYGIRSLVDTFKELKEAVLAPVEAFTTLGEQTEQLQRVTGMEAEQASGLLSTLERFGVSADQAGVGLGIFEKHLQGVEDATTGGVGSSKLFQQTLDSLGVTVIDASGRLLPMNDILIKTQAALAAMPDGATKTADAMNLMGRSGKDWLMFFDQSPAVIQHAQDAARAYGLELSQGGVEAAHAYAQAQKDIGEEFKGLEVTIGAGMAPALTHLDEVLANPATAKSLQEMGTALGLFAANMISFVVDHGPQIEQAFKNMGLSFQDLGTSLHAVGEAVSTTGGMIHDTGPKFDTLGTAAHAAVGEMSSFDTVVGKDGQAHLGAYGLMLLDVGRAFDWFGGRVHDAAGLQDMYKMETYDSTAATIAQGLASDQALASFKNTGASLADLGAKQHVWSDAMLVDTVATGNLSHAQSELADRFAEQTTTADTNTAALASNTAAKAQAAAIEQQLKDLVKDQADRQAAANTMEKKDAEAANKAVLDGTLDTIKQEQTAYDRRAATDIKDRQDQTQDALRSLATLNTAEGVAAAAANTAEGVKQAARQKTADESDAAWKREVANIKAAADAGENALHTSNDAILKGATDTANDTYTAQAAAISADIHNREEADGRAIHSRELATASAIAGIEAQKTADLRAVDEEIKAHERATAAAIAGVEAQKTAALRAVDEETKAYEAQEAARIKIIDATASAQVKALNESLADEKQANTERLAIQAMTKTSGAVAGQQLGQFLTAQDAVRADTQAALDAKAAGNQALADQDTAAAQQQLATATDLSAQLSAINQATADQMIAYRIQLDSDTTAAQVASIQQQATDQKSGLTQQLQAFKETEADKKQAINDAAAAQKALLTQQLADYKWNMAQSLQAFKDTEAAKLVGDKATLDQALTNIATHQTAENTRHADALAKIAQKAAADTLAIDTLATRRKDDATAETAARNATYAAATAQRAVAYADATEKINAQSKLDIDTLTNAKTAADDAFKDRTDKANTHYAQVQTDITTTYNSEQAQLKATADANATAFTAMKANVDSYNGSLQQAISLQAQLAGAAAAQAAGGALSQHLSTGQTGGGIGAPPPGMPGGGPDGTNTARGDEIARAAQGLSGSRYWDGSESYCETFVEDASGVGNRGPTALAAWAGWGQAQQTQGEPRPGDILYFNYPPSGHAAIYEGNGMMRSALTGGVTDMSVADYVKYNHAPMLGYVQPYSVGGVVPGAPGQPQLAVVHGGEEYLGINGERGRLGGAPVIDYEQLGREVAKALVGLSVTLDGRAVGELLRTDGRRFAASSPANGVGGR